jgi:hypothetical protein
MREREPDLLEAEVLDRAFDRERRDEGGDHAGSAGA